MKTHLENLPRTVALERDAERACFVYVDQQKLPAELVFAHTSDWRAVVDAVRRLAVRGAPAIGVAGAAAVALWASNAKVRSSGTSDGAERDARFWQELVAVADEVAAARPTAVNLDWAVRRAVEVARECLASGGDARQVADALFDEVKLMEAEDEAANRAIGAHGAALLPRGARVLTHCNAGSLATVFFGTALGIVYTAAAEGKIERVYADETRPVGQGARLTVWELSRAGVPTTLICDDMAASLMVNGRVDAVVVGADRVAANGDAANKIGTYGLAVLARYHGLPFFVAAPTSSIDLTLPDGSRIPIEERDPAEVAERVPEGVEVWNPAFDVTPAALITHIVTERGAFIPGELARLLQ